MDFKWFVTVDEETSKIRFYVSIKSAIEVLVSGTQIYNMVGFQDPNREDGQWDYLRCAVNFDGDVNANANTRKWVISDHYSTEIPYSAGVPLLGFDDQ